MAHPLGRTLGVVSVAELTQLGWSLAQRRAAVASGRLVRIRAGWLARADANAEVVSAVRAGGCVACASALRLHGAWVPPRLTGSHVRRARRGGARTTGCRRFGEQPPVDGAVDDVATAFQCLTRCGTDEDIVVIADSLLHLGLATREDLSDWCCTAPRRIRRLLDRVDAAESGIESMVRLRLRSLRIRVRTQVRIGRYRVDLLVGDLPVIECDGSEHHRSWESHEADRERDRALVAEGYRVLRVTYRQIVHDWPAVEEHILQAIRRREHLAPRVTR